MPNPFKHKGANLNVDPARALERHGFGNKVALVAARWQRVESVLGYAFAFLLATEDDAALEIYNTLIDRNLRKQAFVAVATGRLPKHLVAEGVALYEEARRLAARRNEVVHAVWTVLDSRPKSLFKVDPAEELRMMHKLTFPDPKGAENFEFTLTEYTIGDFDDLLYDIEYFYAHCSRHMWLVSRFVMLLDDPPRPLRPIRPPPRKGSSTPAEGRQTKQEPHPSPPEPEPPSLS